ncbi:unnamed protein product [Ectocarpus sp. 12 AP-2014]
MACRRPDRVARRATHHQRGPHQADSRPFSFLWPSFIFFLSLTAVVKILRRSEEDQTPHAGRQSSCQVPNQRWRVLQRSTGTHGPCPCTTLIHIPVFFFLTIYCTLYTPRIRIPDDSVFSSGLVDLIRRCLTASPTHRPSASEVEAGIHALSKGNPLPPPRHKKKSSEADCGHAAGTAAASVGGVAAQAATAPASNSGGLSNSVGTLARSNIVGGRGDEGSGRTVTAAGAAGKSNSQQVLTPPKAKPVAAQPQLNPNSVAARRLASRKGSASSNNTRSRNCLVPPPPPPPPPSEQRPDDDGGAPGGGGGSPTGWPGASTAAAAAATVASGACGGGGHPDPDGWSNFAAFDQFPEALDLSTSGRQQGCSNFGEAPFESPVAAVRESPQVMNVTPPVSEKRQSGGRRAVAGGVAALREQLEGTSFMPPPPEQQQRQQQQQQHQQQQLVGKITPIGRAASLAGGGGNQQQAWLMAPPAGQAAPGVDRPLSGRVENVFPATFPRQASGGGGVASDASIGIGSSPQRRQQQQQQQQQPSRSPSPPLPPPQAVFLGGAATSPTQSMAFLSPSVGTAGSMQQQQGLGQVPQLQQQRQRSSAQQQQQQHGRPEIPRQTLVRPWVITTLAGLTAAAPLGLPQRG